MKDAQGHLSRRVVQELRSHLWPTFQVYYQLSVPMALTGAVVYFPPARKLFIKILFLLPMSAFGLRWGMH